MTAIMPVTAARHYDSPPQKSEVKGASTWLTRGANFVVAVSTVTAGAVLERENTPDESMVFLPDAAATIEAGDETIEAPADSLTIAPPGPSRVTMRQDGTVVRLFSDKAADLAALAINAGLYAAGAPGVAPIVPWPDPPGGFRLRNYRLADYIRPGTNTRIFRCTNLMINILERRAVARDTAKLSPHSHNDFEQASLALEGRYIHHIRYPWGIDMAEWREDEHIDVGSPSVTIITPKAIHTSRNIDGPGFLIDIFAPPRADFSSQPGLVQNADEYPMPPTQSMT